MEAARRVCHLLHAQVSSLLASLYWLLHGLLFGHPCTTPACRCTSYDDRPLFRRLALESGERLYATRLLDSGAVGSPLLCDACGCARGAHARLSHRTLEAEHVPNGGVVAIEQAAREAAARRAARAPAGSRLAARKATCATWKDERVGDGAVVGSGTNVLARYRGTFESDGGMFDEGDELRFVVGRGEVVIGLEEGVRGMRAGGTRVVTVPPMLAYGEGKEVEGRVGETLVFTVTVLAAVGP